MDIENAVIGMRIRIVKQSKITQFVPSIGQTGTIKEIDAPDWLKINYDSHPDNRLWIEPTCVEPEYDLKINDIVMYTSDKDTLVGSYLPLGSIGKVIAQNTDKIPQIQFIDYKTYYMKHSCLTLVTSNDEIKTMRTELKL